MEHVGLVCRGRVVADQTDVRTDGWTLEDMLCPCPFYPFAHTLALPCAHDLVWLLPQPPHPSVTVPATYYIYSYPIVITPVRLFPTHMPVNARGSPPLPTTPWFPTLPHTHTHPTHLRDCAGSPCCSLGYHIPTLHLLVCLGITIYLCITRVPTHTFTFTSFF